MPGSWALERFESNGEVRIRRGPQLLAVFDKDDLGMRNVVAVGLTDASLACKDVAACFGLSAPYISMLRARRDERTCELFYVDDHFDTYWGAQPVAIDTFTLVIPRRPKATYPHLRFVDLQVRTWATT